MGVRGISPTMDASALQFCDTESRSRILLYSEFVPPDLPECVNPISDVAVSPPKLCFSLPNAWIRDCSYVTLDIARNLGGACVRLRIGLYNFQSASALKHRMNSDIVTL